MIHGSSQRILQGCVGVVPRVVSDSRNLNPLKCLKRSLNSTRAENRTALHKARQVKKVRFKVKK